MTKATMKGLNEAMKAEGIEAELVKGRGYFWFASTGMTEMESIYVYALNHCTHERWMEMIRYSWDRREKF